MFVLVRYTLTGVQLRAPTRNCLVLALALAIVLFLWPLVLVALDAPVLSSPLAVVLWVFSVGGAFEYSIKKC